MQHAIKRLLVKLEMKADLFVKQYARGSNFIKVMVSFYRL